MQAEDDVPVEVNQAAEDTVHEAKADDIDMEQEKPKERIGKRTRSEGQDECEKKPKIQEPAGVKRAADTVEAV